MSRYELAVAEVLLQKTRAAAVEPVWRRLVARYPTAASLIESREVDVRRIVSGLGLGSQRSARLLAMAQSIASDGDLRGLGPYGRAVVGLARGAPMGAAPVDGNIARVLQRVLGLRWERGEPRKKREVITAMGDLITAAAHPLSLVYAMVDLGALVCMPRHPRCDACPLRDGCAYARVRD